MAIDFDDVEGLEIRRADEIGFGVYARLYSDEDVRLIAAFAEIGGVVPWLQRTLEAWEKRAKDLAAAEG